MAATGALDAPVPGRWPRPPTHQAGCTSFTCSGDKGGSVSRWYGRLRYLPPAAASAKEELDAPKIQADQAVNLSPGSRACSTGRALAHEGVVHLQQADLLQPRWTENTRLDDCRSTRGVSRRRWENAVKPNCVGGRSGERPGRRGVRRRWTDTTRQHDQRRETSSTR